MAELIPQLTFPALNAAASADDFALHEAALEWSLADPIIIESAEDIKSTVNWQDRLKPFHHQVRNLITFCRRLPVTLLTDDVGLGKTISAGLILSELMVRNRVSRTLVICPSILGPQWIEELESKFGIHGVFAKGGDLDGQLLGTSDVVSTTYQTASKRLAKIQPGQFDMLIIDEAHKLRNLYGSQKSPKMAEQIRKALNDRLFKYVLLLTATPIQNRLWDIYSLVDCLTVAKGHANPLGNPDQFKVRYIADRDARQLYPWKAEEFRSILRQYLARTRRQDAKLSFPEREVRLYDVEPSIVDEKIQALIALHIDRLNGLQQSSVGVAMMSSPQALIAQLHNMAKRDPHWTAVAADAEWIIRDGHLPSKLKGLLEIIELARTERRTDWRVVIFTTRVETQKVICRRLDEKGIKFGTIQGGDPVKNTATVKAFTSGVPTINVIVSTDSGAEGINLQAGNVLVNYDLPWNPMVVEQRIGRIQRLGSKHQHVIIHNMAVIGSPEEKIVKRLLSKLQVIVETIGDIEAILEASYGDRDDAGESFEKQIRELFVKSLKGHDNSEMLLKQERSIERAKAEYEEHRAFMDDTLGQLDDLHHTGPNMPRLTQVSPTMASEEFVKQALEADGYVLSAINAKEFSAEKRGSPAEFITFDEQYWRAAARSETASRKPSQLYRPGKPAFEKLVQRWVERSGHFTKTVVDQTSPLAKKLALRWVERIENSSLQSVTVVSARTQFQGRSRLRVTASNAVDSYEKLVELETVPEGHDRVFDRDVENAKIVYQAIEADGIADAIKQASRTVSSEDADITGFCDFYSSRLDEELAKAGNDAHRLKKVQDDFLPAVKAQTVAVTGIRYHECRLRIEFAIDGKEGYKAEIQAVPLTGQIITEFDTWAECQKSGRSVPSTCLDTCCISGVDVLRHYLATSDESGRKALEEHANVCQITGLVALNDEFLVSDVSGRRAVASVFQTSEMSARRGLAEECVICDFTGSRVLNDEFETSSISGKKYRRDQHTSSAVSNRFGHQSEFVTCDFSKTVALPEECSESDFSGRLLRRDLMELSSRPSKRCGAPDEMIVCAVTGIPLLIDEVAKCEITNQVVDDSLLEASAESGRRGLAAQLVTCAVSGHRLLPDETVCSAFSQRTVSRTTAVYSAISGKAMLPDESVKCEITGTVLGPNECVISQLSGVKFRQDEQVRSDLSGRVGHRSEGVKSDWSGCLLLVDEAFQSAVSGKYMEHAAARNSPLSGRTAHVEEFGQCQFTGDLVFPDELVKSDVSGKSLRIDELFASVSGRRGHRSEQIRCAFSGQELLEDEVVPSAVSGTPISRSLAAKSPVSEKLAAAEEFEVCEFTGVRVLPSELITSGVSGKRFRCDEQITSEQSGQVGHRSEGAICSWTSRQLLASEVTRSDVSGRMMAQIDECLSPVDGRRGHPSEFQRCEFTGVLVLQDEVISSAVSHRKFRSDECFTSCTGREGHLSERVECAFSHELLLLDEVVQSSVSGLPVSKTIMQASDLSGKLAAPQELIECEITGALVLPSELVVSELSGKRFRRDEQVLAIKSSRLGHRSESTACEFSGQTFLADEVGISAYSGRTIALAYLHASAESGRLGAPDEFSTCQISGTQLLLDELALSSVSRRTVSRSSLLASEQSGKLALPEEMVFCQASNVRLLADEVVRCAATGLNVDSRLVVQSALSNKRGLADRMLECAATGRRGLPQEFGKCELTGDLVALSVLERCVITEKFVRRDRLVQSSLSGRWMIPTEARPSFRDQRLMCPDEAGKCTWNRGFLPKSELRRCRWTKLTFAADLMGDDGVFRELLRAWEGTSSKVFDAEEGLLRELRTMNEGDLKSLSAAKLIEAPKREIFAVFGELHNYWGFELGKVAFILRRSSSGKKILGRIAFGSIDGRNWNTDES